MFAVLEVEKYEKGLIKYIQRKFDKSKTTLTYCAVKGASPYVKINIKEKSDGIDWAEVRNCAGVCAERLLLSNKIDIPVGFGIQRYYPKLYPSVLMFNNMLEMLGSIRKRNNLSVAVYDKHGALTRQIDKLFDYERHITVLTDNIPDYKIASQRVMDNCGAAIIINDYNSKENKCDIAFADRYDREIMNRYKLVFCPEKLNGYANLIYGTDVSVAGSFLSNKPESIDTFIFLCALYELNSFKEAEKFSYSKLYFCSQEIENKKLLHILNSVL